MKEPIMKEVQLKLPELFLIAATRGMIGLGAGLLLAEKVQPSTRRAVGWTLFAVGAISTIPLAMDVLGKAGCCCKKSDSEASPSI
jgi:hypothetical protein